MDAESKKGRWVVAAQEIVVQQGFFHSSSCPSFFGVSQRQHDQFFDPQRQKSSVVTFFLGVLCVCVNCPHPQSLLAVFFLTEYQIEWTPPKQKPW
jgi:hypothetical protein